MNSPFYFALIDVFAWGNYNGAMEEIRVETFIAMDRAVPKRHIARSDGALYALLLIAIIGIIVAGNALSYRFNLPRLFVQLTLYAVLLALGWFVYRYCLVSFRYTLTERMLRIERIVGKKERAEENVHLSDIAWIRRIAECSGDIGKTRSEYTGRKADALAVRVRAAAKEYTLVLSPSGEFTEKLVRQWKTARK